MNTQAKETLPSKAQSAVAGAAICSAPPCELERACMTMLVGDFWRETSHLKARIYSILAERGRMTVNDHGQMIEVTQNNYSTSLKP